MDRYCRLELFGDRLELLKIVERKKQSALLQL